MIHDTWYLSYEFQLSNAFQHSIVISGGPLPHRPDEGETAKRFLTVRRLISADQVVVLFTYPSSNVHGTGTTLPWYTLCCWSLIMSLGTPVGWLGSSPSWRQSARKNLYIVSWCLLWHGQPQRYPSNSHNQGLATQPWLLRCPALVKTPYSLTAETCGNRNIQHRFSICQMPCPYFQFHDSARRYFECVSASRNMSSSDFRKSSSSSSRSSKPLAILPNWRMKKLNTIKNYNIVGKPLVAPLHLIGIPIVS